MHYGDLTRYMPESRLNEVVHISPRYGYAYVSNAKAACSTIKLYLSRAEHGDATFSPGNVHRRERLPLLRPCDVSADLRADILAGRVFVFSFVRHPVERLLSAYADKIQGGKPEKREILQALGRPARPLRQPVTLRAFVEAVLSTPPRHLNAHWRPQVYNLLWGKLPYSFVGKVEALQPDLAEVRGRLGLPDYDLECRNVKAAAAPGIGDLEPDLLDGLLRLYAWDFRAFGYRPSGLRARAVVFRASRGPLWSRRQWSRPVNRE